MKWKKKFYFRLSFGVPEFEFGVLEDVLDWLVAELELIAELGGNETDASFLLFRLAAAAATAAAAEEADEPTWPAIWLGIWLLFKLVQFELPLLPLLLLLLLIVVELEFVQLFMFALLLILDKVKLLVEVGVWTELGVVVIVGRGVVLLNDDLTALLLDRDDDNLNKLWDESSLRGGSLSLTLSKLFASSNDIFLLSNIESLPNITLAM